MAGYAPVISGAVEGIVDEAVFCRLVRAAGGEPGPIYGKSGKHALVRSLTAYNNAARFAPWLVLIDLDHDADCAPPYRNGLLAAPSARMCLRVAVREVESWLLADRERMADLLDVNPKWLPGEPDAVDDPKQTIVKLARRSRDRAIRRDLVPREGSGRSEGPAYASRLIEFASDDRHGWRPATATRSSDSLSRCLRALRHLVRALRRGQA
jgi:hypothetical protein